MRARIPPLDTEDDLFIVGPVANESLKVVVGNRESNELLGMVEGEPVTEAADAKAETTIVNEIVKAKIIYISSGFTLLLSDFTDGRDITHSDHSKNLKRKFY